MFFIQCHNLPFASAVNTFGLSDNFLYSINLSGFYQSIPEANDNFDIYNTGGGQFTQLFFSGSGNWNGSGYTVSNNYYFGETFDFYLTGENFPSRFSSGITVDQYSFSIGDFTGETFLYYSLSLLNQGSLQTGNYSGVNLNLINRKVETFENYYFSPAYNSGDAFFSFEDNGYLNLGGFNSEYFSAQIRVSDFSGKDTWLNKINLNTGEIFSGEYYRAQLNPSLDAIIYNSRLVDSGVLKEKIFGETIDLKTGGFYVDVQQGTGVLGRFLYSGIKRPDILLGRYEIQNLKYYISGNNPLQSNDYTNTYYIISGGDSYVYAKNGIYLIFGQIVFNDTGNSPPQYYFYISNSLTTGSFVASPSSPIMWPFGPYGDYQGASSGVFYQDQTYSGLVPLDAKITNYASPSDYFQASSRYDWLFSGINKFARVYKNNYSGSLIWNNDYLEYRFYSGFDMDSTGQSVGSGISISNTGEQVIYGYNQSFTGFYIDIKTGGNFESIYGVIYPKINILSSIGGYDVYEPLIYYSGINENSGICSSPSGIIEKNKYFDVFSIDAKVIQYFNDTYAKTVLAAPSVGVDFSVSPDRYVLTQNKFDLKNITLGDCFIEYSIGVNVFQTDLGNVSWSGYQNSDVPSGRGVGLFYDLSNATIKKDI